MKEEMVVPPKDLSFKTKLFVWPLQLVCSGILLGTAWAKLSSKPLSIMLFTELGMEPTGRYLIGVIELIAAVFMLTNRLAATGALLAVGVMCGAIIAHVSILGYNVMDDNGRHIIMLSIVLICSLTIGALRRTQLPFIGNAFQG